MLRQTITSLLLSVVASGLALASQATAAPLSYSSQSYNSVVVESGAIGSTTNLGGTVVPDKEVLLSAQMPGRVIFIAGVEGDWFEKGTLLVKLDDDNLQAQRRSALASLSTARSGLRNSKVQYYSNVVGGPGQAENMGMGMPKLMDEMFTKPMTDMFGTTNGYNPEVTRRAQIYAQGTQIDQARANIAQVKAKLQELDATIRDTRSVAPFSGMIVKKNIERGDTIQPGQPMLNFADTRTLQIKVEVPARLMPGIKKGMVIPARLDVGNTRVETRVAQIYPMADTQRHTVTIKLDMPTDSPGGPGMYAEVMIPDITTPVESLPIIPKSAVEWRGSLPAVYVLVNNTTPELRMIRLGGFVDDTTVSVLSGLEAGERILATPLSHAAGGSHSTSVAPADKNK